MKNKMVKALSIMMSLCMLGGSGVQAAEFSSGTETVNEVPETSETVEFAVTQLRLTIRQMSLMHRRMQSLSLMQRHRMSFLLMKRQMKFRKHKTREVLTVPLLPGTKMLW